MVVLKQFFNQSDLEIQNETLRYLPQSEPVILDPDYATTVAVDIYDNATATPYSTHEVTESSMGHSEKLIMIGCGPVGIGNNFSVLYSTSSGERAQFYSYISVMIFVILYCLVQ